VEILEMVHHFNQPDVFSKGQFHCHAFEKNTRRYDPTDKEVAIIVLSSSNTYLSFGNHTLDLTNEHQNSFRWNGHDFQTLISFVGSSPQFPIDCQH
jgi:hypothetical protein